MSFSEEHQKVVVVLIAGITFVSISGIYAYKLRSDAQTTAVAQAKVRAERIAAQAPDTGDADSDGSPDWQEILYGTDPNNPDTAGDGVGDTQTIANKKAEKEQEYGLTASGAPTEGTAYTTKTAQAADKLLGTYLATQQKKNGEVTPAESTAIVAKTIQTLNELTYEHYTLSNIVSTNDISEKAVLKYRADVRSALQSLSTIQEYELQTYARAVDKNNPADFKKISDAGTVYVTLAKKLSGLVVPSDVADAHADLAESFAYTGAALIGMGKGYDDVVGSYRAVGHFGKAEARVKLAFEGLKIYFLIKQVDDL